MRGQDESDGHDQQRRRRGHEAASRLAAIRGGTNLPRVNDGEAEHGQGAGEAEAEGDDQQHPERHLVLRDRGEQDDEGRGAGDQPGGGAHAERTPAS